MSRIAAVDHSVLQCFYHNCVCTLIEENFIILCVVEWRIIGSLWFD